MAVSTLFIAVVIAVIGCSASYRRHGEDTEHKRWLVDGTNGDPLPVADGLQTNHQQQKTRCYECDYLNDPSLCKHATMCQDGEECIIQAFVQMESPLFRQGCASRKQCEILQAHASLHAGRGAKRLLAIQIAAGCCNSDLCNDFDPTNKASTIAATTTVTARPTTIKQNYSTPAAPPTKPTTTTVTSKSTFTTPTTTTSSTALTTPSPKTTPTTTSTPKPMTTTTISATQNLITTRPTKSTTPITTKPVNQCENKVGVNCFILNQQHVCNFPKLAHEYCPAFCGIC